MFRAIRTFKKIQKILWSSFEYWFYLSIFVEVDFSILMSFLRDTGI